MTERNSEASEAPMVNVRPPYVAFNPMSDHNVLLSIGYALQSHAYGWLHHLMLHDDDSSIEDKSEWVDDARQISDEIKLVAKKLIMLSNRIDAACDTSDYQIVQASIRLNNGYAGEA